MCFFVDAFVAFGLSWQFGGARFVVHDCSNHLSLIIDNESPPGYSISSKIQGSDVYLICASDISLLAGISVFPSIYLSFC